jgi:DinB superfamily
MAEILGQARALLAITPARWQALVAAADGDLLDRAPAAGEWSALGCLGHLLEAEEHVFPVRVRAFMAGADFPAFDPDSQGTPVGSTADAPRMVERFARLRTASIDLLAGVAAADLGRTARHAELGIVTLDEQLNEWIAHDLMHTVQAERALMQPFIPASGPWRALFAEHEAGSARV